MKPGVLKIFIFSDEDFSILNFNRLMIKLSIDRRNYVNKFKNYEDKCNSLIAYLLTVYGIKKIFNTELSGLSFSYTNFGKPYFTNYPNIHFNISHIKSKVICAISDNPVGVDIQDIVEIKKNCYSSVLSTNEIEYLSTHDNSNIEFLRIWAIKEAYTKYTGLGLNQDFDKLNIVSSESNDINFNGTNIHVFCNENYYIAVCSKGCSNNCKIEKVNLKDLLSLV